MAADKLTRRQRLDDEYLPLLIPNKSEPVCFYGPSLITVIFNVQTIVDATLFFISGGHLRYSFRPLDLHPEVSAVKFVNPRIPNFFTHLLPDDVVVESKRGRRAKPEEEPAKKRGAQRARKRCAFFTVQVTRQGRPGESPIVQLSADVKLFHKTAHVCGLRDVRDAKIVMNFIHAVFMENQSHLDRIRNAASSGDALRQMSMGDATRYAFLTSNNWCCSVPLIVSEGDVVMTNICGRFPHSLNLRASYLALAINYPGILSYLTTMSKSNYLVVTLFEHFPFEPVRNKAELGIEGTEEVRAARHSYLMSSKKLRAKLRKHTFFIYASGRFIQSSRNNVTALSYTERCMKLLHTVSEGVEAPVVIEDEEEEEEHSEDL
jgi:hypothetical protein